MSNAPQALFIREAERILDLVITEPVNALGGYGPGGETIYNGHPDGCPSVLVTALDRAKATFMSNGSIAFEVTLDSGMEVGVLDGHFDATEKREVGVPSNNLWLRLDDGTTAGLIDAQGGIGLAPEWVRIVKLGDPQRAMWFCAGFAPRPGVSFRTAVQLRLVDTPAGPALLRLAYLGNTGYGPLAGDLWSYFNLHGTQRFVYNKEIWYDAGMPLSPSETVVSCTVPYSDIVQVKRVSSATGRGLSAAEATCDYTAFIGDSGCSVRAPLAVRRGRFGAGAGARLNRFSIASIAAGRFAVDLGPGDSTWLAQELLYIDAPERCAAFRAGSSCKDADYPRVAKAFAEAAADLVEHTPGITQTLAALAGSREPAPAAFAVELPRQQVVGSYVRSLWTGVSELYENCRAHGAKLAQGIELGTRDRGQDMWAKLKEAPARVRADLVHALGFQYRTVAEGARWSSPLTRREKLHGMFPRQYPSRWDDRSVEVKNDNRPYNDSPIWLVDSLNLYVRETGDLSILGEVVPSVRLTQPDTPETSGLVGGPERCPVAGTIVAIFDAYGRQVADSPYGLVQAMYGDWCDPLDMFGTSVVGDPATRGMGRGAQVRLSAHVFATLVEAIDTLSSPCAAALLPADVAAALPRLRTLANTIRRNAVRFAWEDGERAGFISVIHELKADGSLPDYARGDIGYSLGSMRGSDFDGAGRRDVTVLAYGMRMLGLRRDWLEPVPDADGMIAAILRTCDGWMFAPKLGLRLLHPPIANNAEAVRLVGRMGILPAGCAENGEYHHGQVMLHRFRLALPGQADEAWNRFIPMLSATRDEGLAGPFEMPSTSYASDGDDPHFGKGMYFGLSGSTDWIIEYFQEMAGVELALHDARRPALRVVPRLPAALGGEMTLRRILHVARRDGGYRCIPLTVSISRGDADRVRINGAVADEATVQRLDGIERLDISIEAIPRPDPMRAPLAVSAGA
jgi:hypothetical protein